VPLPQRVDVGPITQQLLGGYQGGAPGAGRGLVAIGVASGGVLSVLTVEFGN
jgi:hypothetical protein